MHHCKCMEVEHRENSGMPEKCCYCERQAYPSEAPDQIMSWVSPQMDATGDCKNCIYNGLKSHGAMP